MKRSLSLRVLRIAWTVAVLFTLGACTRSVVPDGGPAPGAGLQSHVLASGLEIPWALDFLPDGRILITERPGRLRVYAGAGGLLAQPMAQIEMVAHQGEAGLLGIAVHPRFEQQPYVFLYHTYVDGSSLSNRVLRYRVGDTGLGNASTIIDGIPGARTHNGGRIRFGPDGCLYVTTGDAAVPELAQDVTSLAGKILRLQEDGSIPADNPFPGSPVYSLGHRNPQGVAWDERGRLWATEHGSSATDELNVIQPGRNYGWPIIRGEEESAGLEPPVIHSGRDTWAPSGLAYAAGTLYFSGLRGNALFSFKPSSNEFSSHLSGQFGRLREAVAGPDGALYLLSSNRDGRGRPAPDDDRLIRVEMR